MVLLFFFFQFNFLILFDPFVFWFTKKKKKLNSLDTNTSCKKSSIGPMKKEIKDKIVQIGFFFLMFQC